MAKWQAGAVSRSEIDELATLTAHTYGRMWKRSGDPDYYSWKLFDSDSPIPNGQVARDGEHVVGYQASCHRRFRFAKDATWSTELGDSMVHADYRRQGMWETLTSRVIDNALEHDFNPVYGFPNKLSFPGYVKKLNMAHLFDVWRMVLIHRPAEVVAERRIPGVLAEAAHLPVATMRAITRRMMSRLKSDVKIERPVSFGDWADELWERAQVNDEAGVVKDRQYLNWRFEQNPDVYRIYRAVRQNETVGLLVTKIRAKAPDQVFGFIADMLVPSYDRTIMHKLLLEAEFDFQADRVILIDVWSTVHPFYMPTLVSFGFIPVQRLPFIVPQSQAADLSDAGWANSRRWVLTMADSDNI